MVMVKKVIGIQLLAALLFSGCSFRDQRVQVDLKVPEALVVTTWETVKEIKELQEQNTVESNQLAAELFEERPVIEDEQVINKVFTEINKLQGVTSKTSGIVNESFLFSFDLIDDREKGLDGNDYSKDLRAFIVINEDTIVIPMLDGGEDTPLSEKAPYFVKVKISTELYELLSSLTENP